MAGGEVSPYLGCDSRVALDSKLLVPEDLSTIKLSINHAHHGSYINHLSLYGLKNSVSSKLQSSSGIEEFHIQSQE